MNLNTQCLKFFDSIEFTNYSYKFHYAHDRKLIYCVIIEKWKKRNSTTWTIQREKPTKYQNMH